jgi:hypothetical protein
LEPFERRPARPVLVLFHCLVFSVAVLLLGFLLTRVGLSTWDTTAHRQYMEWLIGKWTGQEVPVPFETLKWYGPLWEYVLALFTRALRFLRDPLWVRHAVTFALLPWTLVGAYRALRAGGESRGTALLAVALLSSNIRFVGHSLLNVKDFPFACGYLLCTLLLWSLLNRKLLAPDSLLERPGWLFAATLVSVVPYLLRAPVVLHWLLLVALCLWAALLESKDLPGRRKWLVAALPLMTGPLMVWVLWPTLWETGLRGFPASFGLFSKFAWWGHVRLFGRSYLATEVPWWYGPAWIPVSWEPVGLAALAIGLPAFAVRAAREMLRARPWWSVSLLVRSLPVWVALFALAPWASVLVLRPVLYDEERHLLFAMPLLAVGAALGLGGLGEKAKVGLACLVLASVAQAVTSWGKYAYVYKDPLLPRTANEDFMGDYWGACSGAMAQALYDHVPDGSTVVVITPLDSLLEELKRREDSLLVGAPRPKSFRLEDKGPPSGPFYVVAMNRNGVNRRVLEDLAAGRAREIWSERMPPGDAVAAVLAYYTEPCPHCRFKLHLM